jgi:hypothetical protein
MRLKSSDNRPPHLSWTVAFFLDRRNPARYNSPSRSLQLHLDAPGRQPVTRRSAKCSFSERSLCLATICTGPGAAAAAAAAGRRARAGSIAADGDGSAELSISKSWARIPGPGPKNHGPGPRWASRRRSRAGSPCLAARWAQGWTAPARGGRRCSSGAGWGPKPSPEELASVQNEGLGPVATALGPVATALGPVAIALVPAAIALGPAAIALGPVAKVHADGEERSTMRLRRHQEGPPCTVTRRREYRVVSSSVGAP